MSIAHVTKAATIGKYGAQVMLPGDTEQITFTTAVQSAAFSESTVMIRFIADADAYLAFGANPTADATGLRVPANTPEYFAVREGEKVSVYDGSS